MPVFLSIYSFPLPLCPSGLVPPRILGQLLEVESGVTTALSDLMPLALPQFRTSQLLGAAGRSRPQGAGGKAVKGVNLVYTSSPWDSALDMVGISGSLRFSLGLQVRGEKGRGSPESGEREAGNGGGESKEGATFLYDPPHSSRPGS